MDTGVQRPLANLMAWDPREFLAYLIDRLGRLHDILSAVKRYVVRPSDLEIYNGLMDQIQKMQADIPLFQRIVNTNPQPIFETEVLLNTVRDLVMKFDEEIREENEASFGLANSNETLVNFGPDVDFLSGMEEFGVTH